MRNKKKGGVGRGGVGGTALTDMNEARRARRERGVQKWMNILSCKAQLPLSCLTACVFSRLSPSSPDYLATYRASFVQIRRGKGGGGGAGGEIRLPIKMVHRLGKRKKLLNFISFVSPRTLATASVTNCPAFCFFSHWIASLPTF